MSRETRYSPRLLVAEGAHGSGKSTLARERAVGDGPGAPVTWCVEQERGAVGVRVRVETWGREEQIAAAERELAALRGSR